MKVFICYASEQRDLAQRIALALEGAGIDVFFDREDLSPGGEFNLAIRKAIHGSDLFVFLASREALKEGAYAMTEMGIAQRRWPNPAQRVLTVLADATPMSALPPYLSAVTVLEPTGNLLAETVDAVARWRERRRRRSLIRASALASVVVAVAVLAIWLAKPSLPDGSGAEESTADIDGDVPNSHVYELKNGHLVRLVGSLVQNDSNVEGGIIRNSVESGAWRYNRCYDDHFGQLAGTMPEGNVDISFEISDQLPRHASVVHSDFAEAGFGSCVQAMLVGQTINAAGPHGAGQVLYRFRFLPN
jgi:hypothetical protein